MKKQTQKRIRPKYRTRVMTVLFGGEMRPWVQTLRYEKLPSIVGELSCEYFGLDECSYELERRDAMARAMTKEEEHYLNLYSELRDALLIRDDDDKIVVVDIPLPVEVFYIRDAPRPLVHHSTQPTETDAKSLARFGPHHCFHEIRRQTTLLALMTPEEKKFYEQYWHERDSEPVY